MTTETGAPAANAGISTEQHAADVAAARAEGAAQERARIVAITSLPEAKGREPQALALALEAAVSAEAAAKILATIPLNSGIAARASGMPEAGGNEPPATRSDARAAWGKIAAKINGERAA
jgi:hypothetical protein